MVEHDCDEDPTQPVAPDEQVGYGRPPQHSRFVKGKSGNPKGRPRKDKLAETATVFEQLLNEPVGHVTSQGRRREVSGQEALYRGVTKRALQGDVPAAKAILQMEVDLMNQDADANGGAPEPNKPRGGLLVVPAKLSLEEWEAIAVPSQRLLIEQTWPPEERDK